MSTYESDPNLWDGSLNTGAATPTKADAVGKRYGAKTLGGVGGNLKGEGAFQEVVFEISVAELDSLADMKVRIPPYSRITEALVVVDDAFGTGDTIQPKLDGTACTAAVMAVSAVGVIVGAPHATPANVTTGATAEDLTIDAAALDDGAEGSARCIIRYVRA